MDVIISLLVVVHVIVCFLLVLIVMMQRPKQEGLGAAFGGGMTDQMFGAQTTDVLQKGTVWLSVMFFVITMIMAILISKRHNLDADFQKSLSEGGAVPIEEPVGLPTLPKGAEAIEVPSMTGDDAGTAGEKAAAETKAPVDASATDAKPAPAKGETPAPAKGETKSSEESSKPTVTAPPANEKKESAPPLPGATGEKAPPSPKPKEEVKTSSGSGEASESTGGDKKAEDASSE